MCILFECASLLDMHSVCLEMCIVRMYAAVFSHGSISALLWVAAAVAFGCNLSEPERGAHISIGDYELRR